MKKAKAKALPCCFFSEHCTNTMLRPIYFCTFSLSLHYTTKKTKSNERFDFFRYYFQKTKTSWRGSLFHTPPCHPRRNGETATKGSQREMWVTKMRVALPSPVGEGGPQRGSPKWMKWVLGVLAIAVDEELVWIKKSLIRRYACRLRSFASPAASLEDDRRWWYCGANIMA